MFCKKCHQFYNSAVMVGASPLIETTHNYLHEDQCYTMDKVVSLFKAFFNASNQSETAYLHDPNKRFDVGGPRICDLPSLGQRFMHVYLWPPHYGNDSYPKRCFLFQLVLSDGQSASMICKK